MGEHWIVRKAQLHHLGTIIKEFTVFLVCYWATSCQSQALHLALHSGINLGWLKRPNGVSGLVA